MIKTTVGLLLVLAASSALAVSPLPFHESFPTNYGNGTLLGGGSTLTVWDIGNTGISLGTMVTNTAALTFPGLSAGTGHGLLVTGTPGSTRNKGATFTAQTLSALNSNLYASFLIKIDSLPADPRLVAGFSTTSSGTTASGVMGVWLNNAGQLQLSKNSSTTPAAGTTAALGSGTHLLVLRYSWLENSGNDEVALWVDPASLGAIVPTTLPDITTSSGTDQATLQSLWIFHPTTTTVAATYQLDEFRVGTNWAQVTPTGEVQPPAPTPTPVITHAQLTAGTIILRGTNGPASAIYQVLASTNVTQPLSNWPSIGASTFDLNGNFDSTNSVPAGLAQQYFRLLVGGSLPQLPFAPIISNQPQNLTVIAGQNALFSIVAGGTAPLNYHWFFNTNTPVGGSASSLTLNAVTTNDAGGYAVIVSNSVGTATSVVATLTVLVPPAITASPTNLTVLAGQPAAFEVLASGTAPLRYQWFFNTDTPLANATNSTFNLASAAFADSGIYSVRVTNAAGAVTSAVATLTVFSPPVITTQPQSQSVTVSNNTTFTVTAAGTAPLTYQWFFNTNTPVGGNSNVFTRLNAQTNDAGTYAVIITNNYGAATSSMATLTVNPASAAPDFSLVGFAALNGFASNGTLLAGGTTGGAAGPLVIASNLASFKAYLESPNVYRVLVISNIDLSALANHSGGFPVDYPTGEILVRSHKTIYSTNGATISRGTLRMGKASLGPQQNIIIRNLKFADLWVFDPSGNYDGYGWDYVRLEEGSHHVWVDHCDFDKVYDGMIDVVHGSDYVTVSWNVLRNQKKCSLVGHSESNASEDTGHLNVTYHHNYFVDVDERMPRMRFGNAHVFNTYCENLGGNGIQSTTSAATLVENSHFQFPQAGSLPTREENGGGTGIVKVVSCVISNLPSVNVQFRQYGQSNFLFNAPFVSATPPYSYTNVMHPVSEVPSIVTNWAGVGKLTSF